MSDPKNSLGFFITPSHDCNYLENQKAVTLFADPNFPKNKHLYSALTSIGFRRSGGHLYQPNCETCTACISVRLDVNQFVANKTQKRNWKKNQDLKIQSLPAEFKQDHYLLYQKYMNLRHSGGGMEAHTPETYMEFLKSSWSETEFIEFTLDGKLICVAVVDTLDNALSAVYTFFEPEYEKRSLGRFAILFQIELAKQRNLQWLYLGYWIQECRKMRYKSEYQPMQYFINNEWQDSPEI